MRPASSPAAVCTEDPVALTARAWPRLVRKTPLLLRFLRPHIGVPNTTPVEPSASNYFRQEPGSALGFIDPGFNQASSGDIAVAGAYFVHCAQLACE
jgi:hypothetical protein